LKKSIFNFELNGKEVLGFDKGLKPRDFAGTKLAQSVLCSGYIIYPEGKVDTWQSGGTAAHGSESAETIVVWGPLFPGEILAELIKSDNKDEALDTLRFFLKARMVLEEKYNSAQDVPFRGSAGALIITEKNISSKNESSYPLGTVFFPPAVLFERTLEVEETKTALDYERWVHPALEKSEEISFCAGAMLYRVFCGVDAFSGDNKVEIRRNIHEAVFLPPNLALPALDPKMSELIGRSCGSCGSTGISLGKKAASGGLAKRPNPNEIMKFIGPPASRQVSSWLRILDEKEITKINAEKARYIKKNALTIKTKRFFTRNKIIITASIIVLAIIFFIINDIVRSRSETDIIKGMSPVEVANTYYNAFGELNHALMENCTIGKIGREDIDMVINFFIISRVQQAYEYTSEILIPAQKWVDEGSPDTEKIVFGVTDLKLSAFSMTAENANLTADYLLWTPNFNDEENSRIPERNAYIAELDFVFRKGVWRISNLRRFRQLSGSP
jgi:hypothetical protein